MDSSGWTCIEEEEYDPKQVMTIPEVIEKRLLAQEKQRGKVEERGENTYGWALLPDIIIERIFEHLSINERYNASRVCRQWSRGFYMQRSWNLFTLEDNTLTRRKYNYYSGWQYRIDHLRAQLCIFKIGKYIRKLELKTKYNLFNLYEFLMILSFSLERFEGMVKYIRHKRSKKIDNVDKTTPCPQHIQSLRFIFWCDLTTAQDQAAVYGTGGELLQTLKRLIGNLKELRNLELIDLLLDPHEALYLLDEACVLVTDRLYSLTLINATKVHFNIIHPGVFVNLRILKISPQNLSSTLIDMLCDNNSLDHLYIIQNTYTETACPVDAKSWENVRQKFPVSMRVMGKQDREVIWQEKAPVISLLYDCPTTKVNWPSVLTTIEYYGFTLKEYGHIGMPKFTGSRKFSERPDSILLTLVRKCSYLTTLIVRERISTCTAMLLVGMASNLKYFHIRGNALIKKCDYQFHNLELDYNFTLWLKMNCRSFDRMASEIGNILGKKDWKPLTDNQFKWLSNKNVAY